LDQLAETTSLTKRIEADIAHSAWDRQMRVNLKRDLYVRLLEAMGKKFGRSKTSPALRTC